jgi:hypothetical protein
VQRIFKHSTPQKKNQLIQSKIQPLPEDKVEPTKILRAINIINTATTDQLNKIMTPTGFLEFLTNLDSRPTEFKYGRDARGSNLEYNYHLKIHHNSTKRTDEGWVDQPGAVLNAYLEILTEMLRYYGHMARLEICSINMLDTNQPLDNITASQYVNNQQQTDSGTSSPLKYGSPHHTMRKYNQAQQREFLEHTKWRGWSMAAPRG